MAKLEIEFFVSIRTCKEIEKLRMEIRKEFDYPTTPSDRKSELKGALTMLNFIHPQ